MASLAWWCLVICSVAVYLTDANFLTQETSETPARHVVELLLVADYGFYTSWYNKTDQSHTAALHNITQYVGALLHTSNSMYTSLESHGIYITIRPVDILVMTTAGASPWTETIKQSTTAGYQVDPTPILRLFKPESVRLQATVPHDHAMLLTTYNLFHGTGDTFAGYAYTDAECKTKSVSVVEDSADFYTALLIAHELGHSLGCEHDGDSNTCLRGGGYAMDAAFTLANSRKWTFSSCSTAAIKKYINSLNREGSNCLLSIQNPHPSAELISATSRQFGQVYSADQQCQLKYGVGSYLCRDRYRDGNYTTVCLKMNCYLRCTVRDSYRPDKATCYYIDGGDGTPCGDGKWCQKNLCVADNNAPKVPDNCPIGDQAGVVKDNKTCAQLTQHNPTACNDRAITIVCCDTCIKSAATAMVVNSRTSADQHCVEKHGVGSKVCRAALTYDSQVLSDLMCADFQCADPARDGWCLSTRAYDGTPCGNKKWCLNSVCVHDDRAPTVSDNCPWGDVPGVASYGLTCTQMASPRHQWRCYDKYTSKVCCSTCHAVRRNVTGCRYGDKSNWCQTNVPSHDDRRVCYYGHNADLCCDSCTQYGNSADIGCEYGDKAENCRRASCASYGPDNRRQCCHTCKPLFRIAVVG